MKQFIKKSIYFLLFIFIIGASLTPFLPENKYWGNKEYAWKIKEYKKDKYNTVLFGTSRIYRGIDPLVFDSLVNQNNPHPIKSFNMATHASWASETFYLYNEFLKDATLSCNVNLVFMEFQNIMSIRPEKLSSEKVIYYQNLDHYLFMLKYNLNEMLRSSNKIFTSAYSIGAYSFTSFINLTNLKRISMKIYIREPHQAENINERGYLGFEDLVKSKEAVSEKVIKSFTDNIQTYLYQSNKKYNPSYYNKMMKLIHDSEARGIKLIFVLPPVRLTEGMVAVFNALPAENKIEICDPAKYPELYDTENWIDPVHLNKNGSLHLTNFLYANFFKNK